jgi:hypothetical protein
VACAFKRLPSKHFPKSTSESSCLPASAVQKYMFLASFLQASCDAGQQVLEEVKISDKL